MNSLYLNVTDFCNMRCEYCYGNHGQYYKKKHFKNMSFKTACKAIENPQEKILTLFQISSLIMKKKNMIKGTC